MADSALSQLPEVATSTDNDLMYTVQGGNTRRTTRAKIIAPAVRHDAAMSLDDAAKGRARSNISAASLGADGKVPLEELPDELFGDIETVDSEAEMLALDVPKGSIAVRTDVQKNFILKAEPASDLANWVELATPTAPVTSVAGKTGNVELTPSDIDDSGNLQQLAALTLAARQILQTDAAGDLKQVALAANKALATDANGDVAPIDLGTLGRVLLALATGTSGQYVRGDGQLATLNKAAVGLGNVDNTSDASKPISTATQTALNSKINKSGDTGVGSLVMTGALTLENAFNGWHLRILSYGDHESGFWNNEDGMEMSVRNYQAANRSLIKPVGLSEIGGSLIVNGSFSAASKNFRLDHFLDPENKDLVHASFEGPENGLIYRGTTQLQDGRATVNIDNYFGMMPGTFSVLNADFTVFLQVQYGPGSVWLERPIDNGEFTIVGEGMDSAAIVAWMVVARRDDPFIRSDFCKETDANGRLIIEPEKED